LSPDILPGDADRPELAVLPQARLLLPAWFAMSERDTFGPRLRRERERRGISLDTIASVTRVGTDLWEGLERNDFTHWPSGIFARAFVRDYARAVGLDADEVVDDFCRHFPIGDRRAARILKGQAKIVGHENVVVDDPGLLPREGDRRASGRRRADEARAWRIRLAPRAVAAALDALAVLLLAAAGPYFVGTAFWVTTGVVAILYHSASTLSAHGTPGARAVEALRHRVPAFFSVKHA
jgi:transcriptional regulator with XRE-family HTH domain